MSTDATLDRLVQVSPHFTRSVLLVCGRAEALASYIFTPTGGDVFGRIAAALRGEGPVRPWSLTGRYGTGKSAFANFIAQVLAGDDMPFANKLSAFWLRVTKRFTTRFLARAHRCQGKWRAFALCFLTGSRRSICKFLADGHSPQLL
jgi:hypothetical protein